MDYNATVNLPKTAFPMRAGLSKSEPKRLKDWQDNKVYEQVLKKNACFGTRRTKQKYGIG